MVVLQLPKLATRVRFPLPAGSFSEQLSKRPWLLWVQGGGSRVKGIERRRRLHPPAFTLHRERPAVIVIGALSLFIVAADFATAQSRPFSVSCPFEAQVVGSKETTQPVPEPNKPIEEFELTLKIISHTVVPLPKESTRDDGMNDMCYFLEGTTISGTWYTPGQPYATGVNFQPSVDKTKVLTKNSVIKGGIDSYDRVITNVVLVTTGTPDKPSESSVP